MLTKLCFAYATSRKRIKVIEVLMKINTKKRIVCQERNTIASNEESGGGAGRKAYFPDKTRKEPAREGNKKGTIRRLGPDRNRSSSYPGGGTGVPSGSRRIKTDLESFLKERRNICLIHANVSPRFQ